jgi:hypothetical protein
MHWVNKATVCRAIKNVVNVVNRTLFNRVVSWPENIEEEIAILYGMEMKTY